MALPGELAGCGVDVIDCSSGGMAGHSASTSTIRPPGGFGFQVPYAEAIKHGAGIATMAVGLITEPDLADRAIAEERCDLVAIGRQALYNPNSPRMPGRS